jgi:signal peptidase I
VPLVKRTRLRSCLLTSAFVIVVAAGWWFFAPTDIGGSTRYVVTGGTSMEPRFHTGDLAIVRPAGQYHVGDIVAYWSTSLRTVVLHRIHAIQGNTYLFKGDRNDFIDPIHPTRAELLGKLWLHIPGGGKWLDALHSPVNAAVICGLLAIGLLGFGERRRQRHRRRRRDLGSNHTGIPLVHGPRHHDEQHRSINHGALLAASALALAVFAALAAIAFALPASNPSARITPYTQKVTFGYTVHVRRSVIYPTGRVTTGDPIFLSMAGSVKLHIDYSLTSSASSGMSGAENVALAISGPGGWHRKFTLVPQTHFTGSHAATDVTLNLPQLQRLVSRIASQIGYTGFGTFSLAVGPQVQMKGTVAGRPISTTFEPALNLQFGGGQLQLTVAKAGASVSGAGSSAVPASGYTQTETGTVSAPATAANALSLFGVSLRISIVRWLAVIALLISGGVTVYFYLRKRGEPFEETFRIRSKYGHMIVPIVAGEDLGWPAVDVPSIKALVKLADSGQRLILHSSAPGVDSYMVNDEGTVYRYQVRPSKLVWGEWSKAEEPPLEQAA